MIIFLFLACSAPHPHAEQREALWKEFQSACVEFSAKPDAPTDTLDRIVKDRTVLDKGTEYASKGWYCYPTRDGEVYEESLDEHMSSEPWR